MTSYHHSIDGQSSALPVGKVVCVGRNYAEHAKELNNPIPTEPVLFIKPSTALVGLGSTISIPQRFGACHFETEMAILIGDRLQQCDALQAEAAVVGVGVALDLTLRDLQTQLKEKSLPWEKAKAFDGACPISPFVSPVRVGDLQNQTIQLHQNSVLKQDGHTTDMLTHVIPLLVYISQFFTLLPGDVLLTGTPAGVGPLAAGDHLTVSLGKVISQSVIVSRD
ncbi:MAG: 5-carboxymethyl-2-hydroxymuconate delta-isomerase [SAR92 bacterium BACL16 MAG-120619-bin48]|jgi:2-keto-4-pentenoate hydratase/2-oxohepta-3-ene-1,7-dioic acid hydratase in catechol pathway|nr:MAG: 5-carboxymethyl-2-hydroxymuconate delta-isomerase [SAR92 bacterium BACL16 MAG-120619-bin48]HAU02084.1 fumarylacetoacetate hydrolase family protein [Porticoccaceae bacterium]